MNDRSLAGLITEPDAELGFRRRLQVQTYFSGSLDRTRQINESEAWG